MSNIPGVLCHELLICDNPSLGLHWLSVLVRAVVPTFTQRQTVRWALMTGAHVCSQWKIKVMLESNVGGSECLFRPHS